MTETIKGTVEGVSIKPIQTKFGQKFKVGVKMNGMWFNMLQSSEQKPCVAGDEVSLTFTEGQYGKDIAKGGLSVLSSSGAQSTGSTGAVANGVVPGITVGNALTNAVTLAAHGQIQVADIEKTFVTLLGISMKAQAGEYSLKGFGDEEVTFNAEF